MIKFREDMTHIEFKEYLLQFSINSIKEFSNLSLVPYHTARRWGTLQHQSQKQIRIPPIVKSWCELYQEVNDCRKLKEQLRKNTIID